MWVRFLRLLRELEPNRHFLKLWLSQGLSLTAFNMVNFTLLVHVYELTNSSLLVSLFVLSFGIPSLLFGAVAGALADRWNRRRVLILTNAIRALVVLLFLPALSTLPTIYLTTFVIATVTQFFTPAEAALIPELVERRRLVAANAAFMVTLFIAFIVGYGIAGPLAAWGGDRLPIILASIMFTVAAVVCWRLPNLPQPHHEMKMGAAYRAVIDGTRAGFRLLRQTPALRYGIWQLTFIWAAIGVVMVILPAFTHQVLGLGTRDVSRVLILPIGLGMLAGGIVLHRLRHHYGLRTIITGWLLLAGLCVVLLGQIGDWSPSLISHGLTLGAGPAHAKEAYVGLLAILVGTAIAVVMIANQTLIQEQTEPTARGRVFGVLGMSINAANTVPVLLTGVITDLFNVTTAVTALGVAMLAWGGISLAVARR